MSRAIVIALVLLWGAPVWAAPMRYMCTLQDGPALSFALDPADFAPPITSAEPPRRQVAQVLWRGEALRAEAILMQDGTAGFMATGRGLLALARPDGRLSVTEGDAAWHGRCTLARS